MHPIYEYGVYRNKFLWFHILGGAVLAKILLIFFVQQLAFEFLLAIALLFEAYQYIKLRIKIKQYSAEIKKVYTKLFILDSWGDVVGALLAALVVIV